jgi:hypothetical protein
LNLSRALIVAVAMAASMFIPAAAVAETTTGAYAGQATDLDEGSPDGDVSLRVAKGGRLIKGLRASPVATCVNPDVIGGIEVVEVPVVLDRIKVKRSGRFARTLTFRAGPPSSAMQTIRVSGRLRKGRVRGGSIVLERRCSDRLSFTAKRRGG